MLVLENIKKAYRKGDQIFNALNGVTAEINKGEFMAIVGPSGSGKSTLLNILGCLDTPTEGNVLYDGAELGKMSENELSSYRKKHIAFIFQSYNLIPVLTVRENIELPLVIDKVRTKKEISQKVMLMIEAVGLSGLQDRFPRELSGGQEQRVAIARALVKDPLLVLADEPTANLDSVTAEEIISLMKGINKTMNTTFLFSTHDPLVQKYAQRIAVLKDGLICSDERK
ncbi:MAG: ABC transporter ATP-binding protein [Chitinispirillaceae bacterium]|nr:ABC transporter ATP-binding protein [Chitinispirillaceae bacterium]